MQVKWIKIFQYIAFFALSLFSSAALLLTLMRSEVISHSESKMVKRQLPKSSFEFLGNAYEDVGVSTLNLNFVPPRLHLPNLRSTLIYYGQNGRPDAALDIPKMYFSLQGSKSVISTGINERVYLLYDKTLTTPCKYTFSPKNEPTMVWFTAEPEGNEAKLTLSMHESEGIAAAQEDPNRSFSLVEKEFIRTANLGSSWEIGKFRVDGSLLARQKARWVGIDRFLENHGGEDFPDFSEKQRLDFAEGDDLYSVYVKKGDCLVWNNDRWQVQEPCPDSSDKPLLVVKKIEERIMSLDLWDVEGKGKVAITLVKAPEVFRLEQITHDFRFVGARTKTQVVFQVDEERLIVKPGDWLLLTKEGWKKLNTIRDIDDYVNRKLVGPLFIFQEIAKKEDKSVLIGSLYNPNRTELHPIEIDMLPNGALIPNSQSLENNIQVATPLAIH